MERLVDERSAQNNGGLAVERQAAAWDPKTAYRHS